MQTPPKHVPDTYAAPLREMLRAELNVGNAVVEVGPSMADPRATLVLLAHRFRAAPAQAPSGMAYRLVNDPHWWYAEYVHIASKDCLACRA